MNEEQMPTFSRHLHGNTTLWNGPLQLFAFAAEFASHRREPMP
jgi:hypothetical protein